MRQWNWFILVDNFRTLEVMSPDDLIWNRFVTNQKMQIWMKYKLDSKKYYHSDVEKYRFISNKILNWCECRHLVTEFWIIATGAICTQSWAILAERFTQDMRRLRCKQWNSMHSSNSCAALSYDHIFISVYDPLLGWHFWMLTLVASPKLRWKLRLCWLSWVCAYVYLHILYIYCEYYIVYSIYILLIIS